MLLVVMVTFLVSCEKDEELPVNQGIGQSSIIGDYIRLDATIVNSDNGIPQGLESLEVSLGDELQLLDDGSFKSVKREGNWKKEGQTLFLYPTIGNSINFEIGEMDGQSLELSQKYESYNAYSDGTVTYTFIKNGTEASINQDLLSSFETWFEKL